VRREDVNFFTQRHQAAGLNEQVELSRCTRRRERVLLHVGHHWPVASERGSFDRMHMTSKCPAWANSRPALFVRGQGTAPLRMNRSSRRAARLLGLLLFLNVILPPRLHAQFDYVTNNGTITLTGYAGPGGAVAIPNTINSLPVTTIGDFAFFNRTNVSSVTVPDSVIAIGYDTFYFCSNLTCVNLPNTLTSIGVGAFGNCSALTNVTIPSSLSVIGAATFVGCAGLNEITIPDGVTNIGSGAFGGCSGATNIAIPNGVTSIGSGAFSYCGSLATIELPHTVTYLGDWPFEYCTNLVHIHLPSSATNIGQSAFEGCIRLSDVTIPDGVAMIGQAAFSNCGSLTNITIPGSATNIGAYAFSFCSNLAGILFKGDAPFFASYVFHNAPNVTAYFLPGTRGWDATVGIPRGLWNPHFETSSIRVGTEGFSFNIAGSVNIPLVLEAWTSATFDWEALLSCTLTNGSLHYTDAYCTNYPIRFYRIRSP
jgi:hypothetical protein